MTNIRELNPHDPITVNTASSTPFFTSTRSDLSSSVTLTQTGANTLSCSSIFTAAQGDFSGQTTSPIIGTNSNINGSSSSGVTGLWLGDVAYGINVITREKVATNQTNTCIYSEYGYGVAVKAATFFNGSATFYGTVTGVGGYVNGSDKRLKKNIKKLTNVIPKLMNLEGVSFRYSKLSKIKDGKIHAGLIAQKVLLNIPGMVYEMENGYLGLSYSEAIPYLIEGFKLQQREIMKLKNELRRISKKNLSLK